MSETEDLYPEFVRGMEIAVERGVSSGSLRNFLVMWRNVHGRPSAVTMIQTFLAEEGLKVDNLETDLNAVLGDDWRQTQIQLSPAIGRKVLASLETKRIDWGTYLGQEPFAKDFLEPPTDPVPEGFFDTTRSASANVRCVLPREMVPDLLERVFEIPSSAVIGIFEGFDTGNVDLAPAFGDLEYHLTERSGTFRAWNDEVAFSLEKTVPEGNVLMFLFYSR
jgi:hypothetical protein